MEFVRDLSISEANQRIVRAIVQIAAQADMRTVAEGGEGRRSAGPAPRARSRHAQGFHIARPAPLPDH